jgi:uracil phosphoribosyltransferase
MASPQQCGMSSQHPEHPNLVVFEHPLIQHKLSFIRDAKTGYRPFRALLAQIAGLMVFEVTRSFATEPVDVQTPMETTRCRRIAGTITLVPILRSGLGMTEGILDIMPEARVAHLGMARDEHTLQPKVYLQKFPKDLGAGPVVVVDPMLATGGSAVEAVNILKRSGVGDLRMICLVAAPEGVAHMRASHPDVRIYAAALDRQLNEHGFIMPGLGDAGDRMYGT